MSDETIRRMAERLVPDLVDQGKLLEAGWQIYRLLCLKLQPHEARDDLREAFMAGAETLFSSIVGMLDPGMDRIDKELEPVRAHLKLKYGRTGGHA